MVELVIASIVLMLFGYGFILWWVYRDAQANNMSVWPWMLLIFFTFGNFIGLVAYAIVRVSHVKKAEVVCFNCHTAIPADSHYCPNCGSLNATPLQKEKVSNRPLIAGIALIIISVVMVLVFTFGRLKVFDFDDIKPSYNVAQTKWGNTWNISFGELNGKKNHTFRLKNTNDILVYSSEIKEGTISFELYDTAGKLVDTFASNTADTLRNLQTGQKYHLKVDAQKARGKFKIKVESPE